MLPNEAIETYRKLYDERGFSLTFTNGKKLIEKGWTKRCTTLREFDESLFVDKYGKVRNCSSSMWSSKWCIGFWILMTKLV